MSGLIQEKILLKGLKKRILIIGLMALIAAATVLIFYIYNFQGDLSPDQSKWAEFGDYFGGVLNPIFSFFALIALLMTILVQSHELQLSRIEVTKSSEALSKQSEGQKVQIFENTFFHLVKLHNDIIENTQLSYVDLSEYQADVLNHFSSKEIEKPGRRAFKVIYDAYTFEYQDHLYLNTHTGIGNIISVSYETFYEVFQSYIGHYFRNLYVILRYIDESDITNKKLYVRVIRSQVSSYEFCLLFYNALSEKGRLKLKPLLEKYEFFDNMDLSLLVDPYSEIWLFDIKAFGENDIESYRPECKPSDQT